MILMPNGMSKRVNNKTSVGKQRKLLWKVQLVFVLDGQFDRSDLLRPDPCTVSDQLFPLSEHLLSLSVDAAEETQTLAQLLGACLEPPLVIVLLAALLLIDHFPPPPPSS
jgi:hypothetical protein